jgi:hypothetical protein
MTEVGFSNQAAQQSSCKAQGMGRIWDAGKVAAGKMLGKRAGIPVFQLLNQSIA